VGHQAAQASAGLEAGDQQLIERDRQRATQRDLERVVVQRGHAQQGEREQHEVERDPQQ
jgi:hypothetical protein